MSEYKYLYKYKYIWTVPGNNCGALCGSAKVAQWLGLLGATAVEIGSPWLDTTPHHCCTNTNISTYTNTSITIHTNTNTHIYRYNYTCMYKCDCKKTNTRTGATTVKIVSPWFDKTGRRCPFLKTRDWANESDSCLDFDHHDILFTPHILDFGRQTKMFLLQWLSYQTNVSCHRKVWKDRNFPFQSHSFTLLWDSPKDLLTLCYSLTDVIVSY